MTDPFPVPWTITCQAPLSMEFSRKECWSGLPFPSLMCVCVCVYISFSNIYTSPIYIGSFYDFHV